VRCLSLPLEVGPALKSSGGSDVSTSKPLSTA
jgi:hypothetical protein